jgi:two-component system sensor histidine kinase KdpD
VNRDTARVAPERLLQRLGLSTKRLTVYLAAAPGSGKTHRLLTEGRARMAAGNRVVIGWIETKGRPLLQELAAGIPVIPPRTVDVAGARFLEFDFEAALAAKPDILILDELPHTNHAGSHYAKRWQDALALREAGVGVLTGFNIQHLESAAPIAERLLGFPVREIIPDSFLTAADEVVAIDASPELLADRMRAGLIVRPEDAETALRGAFRPATLRLLRELLMRKIDDLTIPDVEARKVSTAVLLAPAGTDLADVARRAAEIAGALDLALEIAVSTDPNSESAQRVTRAIAAQLIPWPGEPGGVPAGDLSAALIAVPNGPLAEALLAGPIDRDVYVVGPGARSTQASGVDVHPLAQTAGDRLRIGFGKLTIYLGASAGCGKTYAMLDRAQELKAAGVDVVGAFVETHHRADTEAMLGDLEILPRRLIETGGVRRDELDVAALLARHPAVALIDELAHTNAPGSVFAKRYEDVLSVLRAGISVMTTLNIQHLEGLGDPVARMTGVRVRETLPDRILDLADEVIFIDCSPDTLRERLRQGKIYTPERIDRALTNFFREENLAALRELALRESIRARGGRKAQSGISRLFVGVADRARDAGLIRRCAALAARLEVGFTVAHVALRSDASDSDALAELREVCRDLRGRWVSATGADPARGLIAAAQIDGATTIAVEGRRTKIRLFGRAPFARRLLRAGAKELLVLTMAG